MARIGELKCWNPRCQCADVALMQTAGGKLSAKCHKCQFEHWGPVGTKGHRDMMALAQMDENDQGNEAIQAKVSAADRAAATQQNGSIALNTPKPMPRNSIFDTGFSMEKL